MFSGIIPMFPVISQKSCFPGLQAGPWVGEARAPPGRWALGQACCRATHALVYPHQIAGFTLVFTQKIEQLIGTLPFH